uniref:D-lactate dehydratase n=1 Tax=Mycena chlorophos TaxID=658473 RepID=A0ABQ0L583_MYCCL|nr:predicted protein [Mycena chlorophos]
MPSVLFIFTNAAAALNGRATGYYLPEAAHPYYILAPHCAIDFASPTGGEIPIDARSVKNFAEDPDCVKWLADEVVKAKFASAKKLSEVDVNAYDAIFYPGGHGPAIDLPTSEDNIAFASKFYATGKVVSAICHGSAALVGVKDAQGKSIYAGRQATGFSDHKEELVGPFMSLRKRLGTLLQINMVRPREALLGWIFEAVESGFLRPSFRKSADLLQGELPGAYMVNGVPFLLETRMKELGAQYEKAEEPWKSHVVVDGTLITGQNPASASAIGKAILEALSK